jgi:hypothetical protein
MSILGAPAAMANLFEMLRQLEAAHFYGSVEIKYEAGIVVLIRKSETLKPAEPNHGNNRSGNHVERNR